MSADNGVYILKTKDQYRVIHAQAIENLYWTPLKNGLHGEFIATRLVEYFGHTRYTRDFDTAMRVANAIAKDKYLEYGIVVLKIDKKWSTVLNEAKELAPKEIENLKSQSSIWETEIRDLERILTMKS